MGGEVAQARLTQATIAGRSERRGMTNPHALELRREKHGRTPTGRRQHRGEVMRREYYAQCGRCLQAPDGGVVKRGNRGDGNDDDAIYMPRIHEERPSGGL